MRVVSYNILNGGVGRADPVGEVIEAQRADVVVLIEADDDWVVRRLAKRLKMDYVVGPGDGHSAAVLSRWPIVQSINFGAIRAAGPRSWVCVTLNAPGLGTIDVHAIHLHPRATLADEKKRLDQLAYVFRATAADREAGSPHLLAGDFNADAPDQRIDLVRCKAKTRQAFVENGQTIPRDAVAALLANGYVDTLAAARGDAAFEAATFTTYEAGQRVDYVFAFGLRAVDAWVENDRLATYASDHYPVGAEVEAIAHQVMSTKTEHDDTRRKAIDGSAV